MVRAMAEPVSAATIDALDRDLAAGDRVRWLTLAAVPKQHRLDLLALYAFALELARTREVVREAMLGQIRLQWWREQLASLSMVPPFAHPVLEALAPALGAGRLAVAELEALIDARLTDLDDAPPATLADLEAYADATGGALTHLAARLLGAPTPAARIIGTAHTLAALAMAVPFRARCGRVDLPRDLLDAAGVHPSALIEGRGLERVAPVVQAVAVRADAMLNSAPKAASPALLIAVASRRWLKRLARVDYDAYHPALGAPDPWLGVAVSFAAWRGRW
jgi:phytoene synthase